MSHTPHYTWLASGLDNFAPFEDNYFFANFVFNPSLLGGNGFPDTGFFATGEASYEQDASPYFQFPTFNYVTQSNSTPIPGLLSASQTQWVGFPADYITAYGAYYTSGGLLAMTGTTTNIYGLPYTSLEVAVSNGQFATLSPGSNVSGYNYYGGAFYVGTAEPELETVAYYFGRPATDPLPGESSFDVTKVTPPLMLSSVGNSKLIVGCAMQAVLNGSSNVFAYLGQYFTNAFVISNAVITTNAAGVVSEYGEFFPTVPGQVALLTKPDPDQGNIQGVCELDIIRLSLDVNHDGIMDETFTGPDNTSQQMPYNFWVNNNYDRTHSVDCGLSSCDTDEDDLQVAGAPGAENANIPDFMYGTVVPFVGIVPSIPCEKDLEDYARLWTSGISNVMTVMPSNYTVQLTLTGDGAIRIFRAYEPNGGTNYLFDLPTAQAQVSNSASLYVGMLSASTPIILTNRTDHYIWCGVSNGNAQVDLQVLDGNQNVVADSTAYIQLTDIKQMYERWTVGDAPTATTPMTNVYPAEDNFTPGMPTTPFYYPYDPAYDTNDNYILYVLGWNMASWEKDRFAETAFKRLFWQGYHGRFGSFRWPTYYDFPAESFSLQAFNVRNYDNSEYNAWLSAQGLLNKLRDLNAKYPGHVYMLAHSMGNVVAGEALRLAGTNQLVNTYVASQGAVPAHTYDDTIPDYSFIYGINWGPSTPNIYKDWFLSNNAAVGRRINFYNTNDYALQRPRWEFDQLSKTTTSLGGYSYAFDGYPHTGWPNDATPIYTAGGVDDTPPWNWFYKVSFFGTDVTLDIVTNRYEISAHAAQARSTALGRTAGVLNLDRNVDLTRTVNPLWPSDPSGNSYGDHKWHSAEFRSTLMEEQGYWRTLLTSPLDGFGISNP